MKRKDDAELKITASIYRTDMERIDALKGAEESVADVIRRMLDGYDAEANR